MIRIHQVNGGFVEIKRRKPRKKPAEKEVDLVKNIRLSRKNLHEKNLIALY